MINVIKPFFNIWYRLRPPETVSYWKRTDSALAKVTTNKKGYKQLEVQGEKYPMPGFPRGYLLLGTVAEIKKTAKNLVFNEVWKRVNENHSPEEINNYLKNEALPVVLKKVWEARHDMIPPEKMVPACQELYRAMERVEERLPEGEKKSYKLIKDGFTFFLQEDDAYRLRLQWLAPYMRLASRLSLKKIEKLTEKLINAEVVEDMKGRDKLIHFVFKILLQDEHFRRWIQMTIKEINWRKMKLSKADKYYFRGKYFKVDHSRFDY